MLEMFAELGNRIVTGGFKTHLAVYIISSVIGIFILLAMVGFGSALSKSSNVCVAASPSSTRS